MTEPTKDPGRRSLIAMLLAFAALTLVVVCISLVAGFLPKASHHQSGESPAAQDPEAIAFLGPLASGARFEGFHIIRVEATSKARITLEIKAEAGDRFTVDVHARSPSSPPGIAETESLAIYLRTGKGGALTTEAAQRACAALAKALREREESGHRPPHLEPIPPPKPSPI